MSVSEDEVHADQILETRTGSRVPFTMVGDWVLLSDLSPLAKLLYALLFAHVNVTDGERKAWPSLETLASLMKLKQPRSVTKYIDELVTAGALRKVSQRTADGLRTRNAYFVEGEPPPGLTTPTKFSDFYRERNEARRAKSAGQDVVRPSAPHSDQRKRETAGETVERPSAPRTAAERPDDVRSTAPEQDQSPQQDQEGGHVREEAAATDASPDTDAPPPTPKADWAKPETCLCADHLPLVLADPGADIPACVKCARVREWGEKKRAESAVAARAAQRSDADRAASCSWHDEAGWVVDPATGAPFEHPAVHCDHTSTSPETVQAAIDARRQAAAPSSTEEGRARARAIAQQKRLSGSETPAPAPGVTPPSATARKRPVRAAGRVGGGPQHRSPTLEPAAAT